MSVKLFIARPFNAPRFDFSSLNILISTMEFWDKKSRSIRWGIKVPKHKEFFLDSGGFGLVFTYHDYPFKISTYVRLIRLKKPDYAAVMDYPCNKDAMPGIDVRENIRKTVENAEQLINNFSFPKTTIVPVIQGWDWQDYKYCIDLYKQRGIDTGYFAIGTLIHRKNKTVVKPLIVKIVDYLRKWSDADVHAFGIRPTYVEDYKIWSRISSFDTNTWQYDWDADFVKFALPHSKRIEQLKRLIVWVDEINKRFENYKPRDLTAWLKP